MKWVPFTMEDRLPALRKDWRERLADVWSRPIGLCPRKAWPCGLSLGHECAIMTTTAGCKYKSAQPKPRRPQAPRSRVIVVEKKKVKARSKKY